MTRGHFPFASRQRTILLERVVRSNEDRLSRGRSCALYEQFGFEAVQLTGRGAQTPLGSFANDHLQGWVEPKSIGMAGGLANSDAERSVRLATRISRRASLLSLPLKIGDAEHIQQTTQLFVTQGYGGGGGHSSRWCVVAVPSSLFTRFESDREDMVEGEIAVAPIRRSADERIDHSHRRRTASRYCKRMSQLLPQLWVRYN